MRFVLVTNKPWHDQLFSHLDQKYPSSWVRIKTVSQFTEEELRRLKPEWVFIPHWSHIIPASVYENFRCVVFHMTDLPYGRGGSPLQNLIIRGHKSTKISAIHVAKGLDTGDIYLKKDLDLSGTATEIFERSSVIIEEMINEIIEQQPAPVPQTGEVLGFARRKPEESDLSRLSELQEVYDYIRMLDCDGYPRAFIETEHFRIEFENANCSSGMKPAITANVRIFKK